MFKKMRFFNLLLLISPRISVIIFASAKAIQKSQDEKPTEPTALTDIFLLSPLLLLGAPMFLFDYFLLFRKSSWFQISL